MKKRISLILFTCFISSQALALKYMCQKAVRANSGKKESIKAKLNNYQVKGTLEKNRTSLLNQIDASIKAIKSAKCPMDNPDVTRVTSPLLEMRKIVSDTVSSSAPIKENQTTTVTPINEAKKNIQSQQSPAVTKSSKKLSYPCRQVLKRQSGKPAEMERALSFYKEAAKNNKAVAVSPGLGIESKLKAALNDLESSQCPMDHTDVKTVVLKLKSQQKEIGPLYEKLKKGFDKKGKLADPKSYPDLDKDYAFFEYLDKKYSYIERLFDTNVKAEWRELPNQSKTDALSFIGINVKSPIFKFDALKDILMSMRSDGKKYNTNMKNFEKKYADLLKFNNKVKTRYVNLRESGYKKLNKLYTTYLTWMESTFPKFVEMNQRVIKNLTESATELKKPHYLRGVLIPQASKANDQMIELLGIMSDETKKIAAVAKEKQENIMILVKTAEEKLADSLLKSQKLPDEKYTGTDLEKIRKDITNNFKEKNGSNKNLLKVIVVNKDWKVTNYVSWSNSTAYHHHYSDLGVISVVKKTDDVAVLVPTWYRVNHKQKDKVSVGFEYSNEKDVYQNKKILTSNVN